MNGHFFWGSVLVVLLVYSELTFWTFFHFFVELTFWAFFRFYRELTFFVFSIISIIYGLTFRTPDFHFLDPLDFHFFDPKTRFRTPQLDPPSDSVFFVFFTFFSHFSALQVFEAGKSGKKNQEKRSPRGGCPKPRFGGGSGN